MESKYIQLPPMSPDTPIELIEIVWGYAKMEKTEKEKFLAFIQESIKIDTWDVDREKLIRMKEELEPSPYVEEFNLLMQKLIGTLIMQACDMSALVYQYYCIDGKSIKEISEAIHVPENSIEFMTQYYKRKMK